MGWKKKRLKQELKKIYDAPEPVKKAGFLKQFDTRYMSLGEFMWQQLWYVKKKMWLFSAGVFILLVVVSRNMEKETVWMLSALIPYLALAILTEGGRSRAYRMDELEFATRFSLKSLLLARMGAMGALHSVILLILILCTKRIILPQAWDMSYILAPYFLTVCIGICLLRRFRGKESMQICLGVPIFVSLFMVCLNQILPFLYEIKMVKWWILSCIAILFITVRETFLFMKQTEELAWN